MGQILRGMERFGDPELESGISKALKGDERGMERRLERFKGDPNMWQWASPPEEQRASLDKAMGTELHSRVRGDAAVDINFNPGPQKQTITPGLFYDSRLTTMRQMQPADSGPNEPVSSSVWA